MRRKLLSDERYAEARINTLARKFGAARIEHELRRQGVSDTTVANALQATRDTELERARDAWRKRFDAPPRSPQERAKQMRFLHGRGFSGEVIRQVLRGPFDDSFEDPFEND